MNDHTQRLFAMSQTMLYAIDQNSVNIEDLVDCIGGRGFIVRCEGNPADAMKVIVHPSDAALGCVAGWISEEA